MRFKNPHLKRGCGSHVVSGIVMDVKHFIPTEVFDFPQPCNNSPTFAFFSFLSQTCVTSVHGNNAKYLV